MTVIVHQYGIRTRTDAGRWDLPPELVEQMRLAHRMRNALVELEHAHEQRMRDLWSAHPQVAGTEAMLAEVEAALAALLERAAGERSADRTTAARPGTAADLKTAKAAVRDARAVRRAAITEAYPVVKPAVEAEKAARKAAIKACRQAFSTEGLYWATYNMVIADHETARKLVAQRRAGGQAAALRFRRWDGSGTVAVQLQRGAGAPQRTPELLADPGSPWRNVLSLPWRDPDAFVALPRGERKRAGRVIALVSLGGGRAVEVPIHMHRMLPADADVCEATLSIRRVAGQWQGALNVTAKLPDPVAPASGAVVALHCGWRSRPDGSVRVGTWASTVPLEPPAGLLADGVVTCGGARGEIVVPSSWLDVAGRPPALRGRRDTAMEPVREKVAGWLDTHPQPEDPDRPHPSGADVRRWRSAGRLAGLVLRWRTAAPAGDGAAEVVALLEAWRVQDRHLWEWEAHERQQITRRRDQAWRLVGAWLAGVAMQVRVDDVDLAELRRRPAADETDPTLPGVAADRARARSVLAAPGGLRAAVAAAATRRGVPVERVNVAYGSRTCPSCGVVADAGPQFAVSAVVTCGACGVGYDQDVAVVGLMLRERSGG